MWLCMHKEANNSIYSLYVNYMDIVVDCINACYKLAYNIVHQVALPQLSFHTFRCDSIAETTA